MKGNIYINGVIGTFLDDDGFIIKKGVELLDVIMQVKNQPKADSFNVYITSPGGVVTSGWEIHDYLDTLGKPIKTIGREMVGSIATVIFMAGTERELKPGTDFVIHLPSGGINGNSDDISEYAQMIKGVEKKVLKFYEDKTQLSESAILPLLRQETFLRPGDAYKLGFATIRPEKQTPVAYFKNSKNENKMSKSKNKKTLWDEFKNFLKTEGNESILNKIVFSADQTELDFYELEDDDAIVLGTKARVDGADASGEYEIPKEDNPDQSVTYVFETGELTEIREPEAESNETDDEEMNTIKEENESLKKQLSEIQNKVTDKNEKITNLKAAINKIKELEQEETPVLAKKEKPKKPQNEVKKTAASAAIANLKNK